MPKPPVRNPGDTILASEWNQGWNWVQEGHGSGTNVDMVDGLHVGDIVARGTNANGYYVRWSDGTQICTHRVTVAAGSAGATWVYPAAFVVEPKVVLGNVRYIFGGPYAFVMPDIPAGVTTACSIYVRTHSGGLVGSDVEVYVLALGKWK